VQSSVVRRPSSVVEAAWRPAVRGGVSGGGTVAAMRAVQCQTFGPPDSLVVVDVPSPTAGPGQVVLTVKAAGVNFPDVLIIQDKYQFKPPLPFTPGGEVAGVVKEVGEGVTTVAVGDRVIGSVLTGGYAEELALPASACVPIPDGMSDEQAAAFLMTYGTSYHALRDRAALQPGETLLVLGAAGGVGLSAVELGVAMGAKVVAAVSSEAKAELCRDHGAAATLVYPANPLDRDAQKALSEQIKQACASVGAIDGADVIYDPVGDDYAEPALRSIAWKGRYLVVGFAAGQIPKIPLNLALLKGCQIVGVFYGAFTMRQAGDSAANMAALAELVTSGKVMPHVSGRYPLERAHEALNLMAARGVTGKVVVVP
jgi:NADPH:quinone reductase